MTGPRDPDDRRMSKVLYVTSVPPWPLTRNGGGQRTRMLRLALARLGHDVRTICVVPQRVYPPPDAATLEAERVDAWHEIDHRASDASPLPGALGGWHALHRRFKRRHQPDPSARGLVAGCVDDLRPDLVVVRYGWTMARCGLPEAGGRVPCLLDFDDVDWLAMASRHEAEPWPGWTGRVGMRLARRAVRRALLPRARRCGGVVVVSEGDGSELAREGVASTLVPNLPLSEDGAFRLPDPVGDEAGDGRTVLFVGDLRHPPNLEGLRRFLAEVWPAVVRAEPSARLRVVGRGLDDAERARWSRLPNVEPVGFVDDLASVYREAAVATAPAWWGGGTKIKVAEAAAMGRAQVATPAAIRGFEVLADAATPGVIVAEPDGAFAEAIVGLLRDPPRRRALAANALALARRHLSPAIVERQLASAIGPLLGGSTRP